MSTPHNDVQIELLRTTGTLWRESDGFAIENNVWIVGNEHEVIVIDAAHDADAIQRVVAGREVKAILLTHGHEDHVNAALDTAQALESDLYLHDDDLFLWSATHPETNPHRSLGHGDTYEVGGEVLETRHTPGHTPGSVCFVLNGLRTVISGDTLFHGGPGATRWEYSSFSTIIDSIQSELFTLDDDFLVLPGHGEGTTIGSEKTQLQAYIERGW